MTYSIKNKFKKYDGIICRAFSSSEETRRELPLVPSKKPTEIEQFQVNTEILLGTTVLTETDSDQRSLIIERLKPELFKFSLFKLEKNQSFCFPEYWIDFNLGLISMFTDKNEYIILPLLQTLQSFPKPTASLTKVDASTGDEASFPYFKQFVQNVLFIFQYTKKILLEKQIYLYMETVKQLYNAYNSVYLNCEILISTLFSVNIFLWENQGEMQYKSKQNLLIRKRAFLRRNSNYKKRKNTIMLKKQLMFGIYFFCYNISETVIKSLSTFSTVSLEEFWLIMLEFLPVCNSLSEFCEGKKKRMKFTNFNKILKQLVKFNPDVFLSAFEKVYDDDLAKEEDGYWSKSEKERMQARKNSKDSRQRSYKEIEAYSHEAEILSIKNLEWLTSLVVYAASLVFEKQMSLQKAKQKKQVLELKKKISQIEKREAACIKKLQVPNLLKQTRQDLKQTFKRLKLYKKIFKESLKKSQQINKWQKPFNTEICNLLLFYVDERKSWLPLYDYAFRDPNQLESVYLKLKKSSLLRTKLNSFAKIHCSASLDSTQKVALNKNKDANFATVLPKFGNILDEPHVRFVLETCTDLPKKQANKVTSNTLSDLLPTLLEVNPSVPNYDNLVEYVLKETLPKQTFGKLERTKQQFVLLLSLGLAVEVNDELNVKKQKSGNGLYGLVCLFNSTIVSNLLDSEHRIPLVIYPDFFNCDFLLPEENKDLEYQIAHLFPINSMSDQKMTEKPDPNSQMLRGEETRIVKTCLYLPKKVHSAFDKQKLSKILIHKNLLDENWLKLENKSSFIPTISQFLKVYNQDNNFYKLNLEKLNLDSYFVDLDSMENAILKTLREQTPIKAELISLYVYLGLCKRAIWKLETNDNKENLLRFVPAPDQVQFFCHYNAEFLTKLNEKISKLYDQLLCQSILNKISQTQFLAQKLSNPDVRESEACRKTTMEIDKNINLFLNNTSKAVCQEQITSFFLHIRECSVLIDRVTKNTKHFNNIAKMLFFVTFIDNLRFLYKTGNMDKLDWSKFIESKIVVVEDIAKRLYDLPQEEKSNLLTNEKIYQLLDSLHSFPELETSSKTHNFLSSVRELQCLIANLFTAETLRDFQTNINTESGNDKLLKVLDSLLYKSYQNINLIHGKLDDPSELGLETTTYSLGSLKRIVNYLWVLLTLNRSLATIFRPNSFKLNQPAITRLRSTFIDGVKSTLPQLLLASDDMIPNSNQVPFMLAFSKFIQRKDQLSLQKNQTKLLNEIFYELNKPPALEIDAGLTAFEKKLETAFEEKQNFSIVLASQSYTKKQSGYLLEVLQGFRIPDAVGINLQQQTKMKFYKQLNQLEGEISILNIESIYWDEKNFFEDISEFCLTLKFFEFKLILQENPNPSISDSTEIKNLKQEEVNNFIQNYENIRRYRVKLYLFCFRKNGTRFANPKKNLRKEQLQELLTKGKKCKWFNSKGELSEAMQEQFYTRTLSLDEIKEFSS